MNPLYLTKIHLVSLLCVVQSLDDVKGPPYLVIIASAVINLILHGLKVLIRCRPSRLTVGRTKGMTSRQVR
jgi:hypothetical protein